MKRFITYILIVLIVLSSCEKKIEIINKHDGIIRDAKIFYDSLLVLNTSNSIIIKNIRNNERFFFKKRIDKNLFKQCLINENSVFYCSEDNIMDKFDYLSCKKWSYKTDSSINNFVVNNNFIVLSLNNSKIIVLDVKSGKLVFEFKDYFSSNCNSSIKKDLCLNGNELYVGDFQCYNILVINLLNGKVKWKYKSNLDGVTKNYVYKNLIFCGITGNPLENQGEIILFENNGRKIFEKKIQFDLISNVLQFDDKLIFYSYDNKIYEFDFSSKKITVIYDLKDKISICDIELFMIRDNIYFQDCNFKLYKLNYLTKSLCSVNTSKKERVKTIFNEKGKLEIIYPDGLDMHATIPRKFLRARNSESQK